MLGAQSVDPGNGGGGCLLEMSIASIIDRSKLFYQALNQIYAFWKIEQYC